MTNTPSRQPELPERIRLATDIERQLYRGYPLGESYCIVADRTISKYERRQGADRPSYYRVLGWWCGTEEEAKEFMQYVECARAPASPPASEAGLKDTPLFERNNEYMRKLGHCDGLITSMLEIKHRISNVMYYQRNINSRFVRKISARDSKVKGLQEAYDYLETKLRELQSHMKAESSEETFKQAYEVFARNPIDVPTSQPATPMASGEDMASQRLREIDEIVRPFDKGPGHKNTTYDLVQQLVEERATALRAARIEGERIGMAKVACKVYEQSDDTVWLNKHTTIIEEIAHMLDLEGDDNAIREQVDELRHLSPETITNVDTK